MTYILLLILIGLFALILLITQATTPTATTWTNGITTTATGSGRECPIPARCSHFKHSHVGWYHRRGVGGGASGQWHGQRYGWNTINGLFTLQ